MIKSNKCTKSMPYILSGTANKPLAGAIADYCGTHLVETKPRRFNDQEFYVEIIENVRGSDAFVIQPTSKPVNENLMELLITIDALRRSSARRITAVIPYFGYARQDRKTGPRTPITAKLVANQIVSAGADRVLTLDLHAHQIQGFFDIPVDNLFARPLFIKDIYEEFGTDQNPVIVSPDVGGVIRARSYAKHLNADLAIIDKRRPEAGQSEVMHVIGNVEGRNCLIMDDMVDTAGTLCNAAAALKEKGAQKVQAYCTHGILSEPALSRIAQSELEKLIITDTIAPDESIKEHERIRVISADRLLGEGIMRIHNEESVSSLFDDV